MGPGTGPQGWGGVLEGMGPRPHQGTPHPCMESEAGPVSTFLGVCDLRVVFQRKSPEGKHSPHSLSSV